MSTRVHELAKELGLKARELLDRIQMWKLDVKSNVSATVEPAIADRIKELYAQENSATAQSKPSAGPTKPKNLEKEAISTTATAPRPPGPATSPKVEADHEAGKGGISASRADSSIASKPLGGSSPPAAAPLQQTQQKPPTPPPSPANAVSAQQTRPPQQPAGDSAAARPGAPASAGPPPLARGGPLSRSGGPLSGHTPHRTGGQGGALSSRMGGGGSQGSTTQPQPDLRPHPASPAPLKRSDYISPTGTRVPSAAPIPSQGPSSRRQPDSGQGTGSASNDSRRDSMGGRRPLPPVASSAPPMQQRRPDSRPPGPEAKTQRPDKKFTPDQLREMMQSGKIAGGSPSTAAGRPAKPGPGGRTGPGLAARPGAEADPLVARRAAGEPVAPSTLEEEDDQKHRTGRLGSPVDRAGRRAKRTERALTRRVTSPMPASALLTEEEESKRVRVRRGGAHSKKQNRSSTATETHREVIVEPPITVRSLSMAMGVSASQIISKLMALGQLVTINADLDEETAQMLGIEFGVELSIEHPQTAEDEMLASIRARDDSSEELVPRPPIVTILGHVDHGKTSLLDRIRHSNVAKSETGGITQHIGAYTIEHAGKKITFVDTPGHEAFTAMRARGANVTDVVVLVVAADDGVMPQTVEAISHAKAAGVPIVVALNKIDLPNVNLNKIYGELSQQDLLPQEYGGETEVVKTSAITGKGVPELLETLAILADLRELKADPKRPATGTCLEASLSDGRGVVATLMVQDGTLHVGDVLVCGDGFGRVRAVFNDRGESIQEAGPSTPIEVSGLDAVPTAGERFAVVDDISQAREIAETRRLRTRGMNLGERQAVTLENLYSRMAEQKTKSLNLILKADVQGSLEALAKELEKLENPEVPIRVLHKGVGGITESDVLLANASEAIIIGFRVAPEDRAVSLADENAIDIRRYDIIYQVTDEVKKAVEGLLVPEVREVHLGRATVRLAFKISKVGTVAGCIVASGTIERGASARIIREGREIYKGQIDALKRFKDDAKEVRGGFECGIKIANFDDVKVGDTIEAFKIEKIRRTL